MLLLLVADGGQRTEKRKWSGPPLAGSSVAAKTSDEVNDGSPGGF